MLSGRTLRGGLQTGFQPAACSLCADGVRRYSARINAFILLPLYYSGAAQGSQGGNKERFRMPAASYGLRHPASASCLGRHLRLAGRGPNNSSLFPPLAAVVVVASHFQRKNYFKFRDIGTPAGVPISHFHGKGAERSGAQSKRWCFTRGNGLPPAVLLPASPALRWAVQRPAGGRGCLASAT